MPCQYCKNPSHRISSCDASVEDWIGSINEIWVSQRYNILFQIETLSKYSQPQLVMVGRSLGMSVPTTSNKGNLIARIVVNRIQTQIVPRVGTISLEERALIHNSYEILLASVFPGFLRIRQPRLVIVDALEEFYVTWVGRKRMSMEIVQFLQMLQPVKVVDINVNQAMQEADECGVCYETKSRVKFNCLHEFCKDCVHLLCADKSVSPIKCPMCRVSVTSFEVEDEASREALLVVA